MSFVENSQSDYAEQAVQRYGYQQEFRRELKRFASFAVGFSFISIIWLLFELSIFRDASFASPWLYTVVMVALGFIYFVWMLIAQPRVLEAPPQEGAPDTVA
jgi:hypothetical protein